MCFYVTFLVADSLLKISNCVDCEIKGRIDEKKCFEGVCFGVRIVIITPDTF